MPFGTVLLITATLAAAGADSPAGKLKSVAIVHDAAARPVAAVAQRAATPAPTERPHQFGIGGSLTASTRGAAGDVRYWFNDHFGVNMTAGWYRSYYQTTTGDRPTTTHASPSVIYMFGKPNYSREVDIRPFVGGGLSYLRSRRPIVAPTGGTRISEASGTGMHAFGGAEMTFKEAEQIALSGELIYYRLPVRLSNTTSMDGLNYLIAVHFYLK